MIDEGTTSIVCSYLKTWQRGTWTRVVQVYYPLQVLIIDWFLEIRHKGSRLKVPFAVTRHIYVSLLIVATWITGLLVQDQD